MSIINTVKKWLNRRTNSDGCVIIKVKDERVNRTPLDTMVVVGEDDPVMSMMINAAFNGEDPVIGNVGEKGILTIKDC